MSDHRGDHGGVDEISHDVGFAAPALPRPRGATSPGARLAALTTALTVVLAGGVVTAAWRSFQPQHSVAELIPASAFAVGTVDLSLPDGQADALQTFADHFPGSPTHRGDGGPVDRLLRAILRTSSDPHVDYDRDVKPWLGDHVGVAGWMDKSGRPQLEVLLQSTDDSAAKSHLSKLLAPGGAVRIADGYAVLGPDDATVRAAIDAAGKSALADNTTYTTDVDALPGHPAATGWVDGPATMRAIKSTMSPDEARMFDRLGAGGPFGLLGPLGLAGVAGTGVGGVMGGGVLGNGSAFQGRTTVGVQVADRYLEIDSRSSNATAHHQSSTAAFRQLPASTIGAVEIGDPSSLVSGATAMAKSFMGLPDQLSVGGSCAAMSPRPLSSQPLTRRQALRLRRKLIRQAMRSSKRCADTFTPPPPTDPLKELTKQTGLELPGDATTVLGDSLVASYGGLSLQGMPKVAVRTHPGDLSAAQAVLARVRNRLGASGFPLTVDTSGDDLLLATSAEYAQALKSTGAFGEQTLVKLALGDLPDAVAAAGYVDLSKILPLLGGVPRDVQTLTAVGFWTAVDHGVQLSEMRVVVG